LGGFFIAKKHNKTNGYETTPVSHFSQLVSAKIISGQKRPFCLSLYLSTVTFDDPTRAARVVDTALVFQ
jgi:hypothetical protein